MIHNEHLRRADEMYEIAHDNNGNAMHIYIKDGTAIVFNCLHDLVQHIYFGDPNVRRKYLLEDELFNYYEKIKL